MTQEQIAQAVKDIQTAKGKERYQLFLALVDIAKNEPKKLEDYWDELIKLFKSDKTDTIYVGGFIIGTLAAHGNKKFIPLYEQYAAQLSHESIVVAPHIAHFLAQIAKAIPELEPKITEKLLNIDKLLKVKHPELPKAYVIEGFAGYYKQSKRKDEIIEFVKKQVDSSSPKTKKAAREFLKSVQV